MALCVFCGEWAGASTDRHPECALEFERQMRQPGLARRVLNTALRAGRNLVGVIAGSVARTG